GVLCLAADDRCKIRRSGSAGSRRATAAAAAHRALARDRKPSRSTALRGRPCCTSTSPRVFQTILCPPASRSWDNLRPPVLLSSSGAAQQLHRDDRARSSRCNCCAAPDELYRTGGRRLSQLLDAGGHKIVWKTRGDVDVQHGLPRSAVDRDGLRSRASAQCAAAAAVARRHPADPERRILHRSSAARQSTPAARPLLLRLRRFSVEQESRTAILIA